MPVGLSVLLFCLSVRMSAHLNFRLSVHLSVCLSVRLPVHLSVCLSDRLNVDFSAIMIARTTKFGMYRNYINVYHTLIKLICNFKRHTHLRTVGHTRF